MLLTAFFEEPFWVLVFERIIDTDLEVCKVTFGSEPKDIEIYKFVLSNYNNLKFSDKVEFHSKAKKTNPKRIRRAINKQLKVDIGTSTKAREALKLQYEQNKLKYKSLKKTKLEEQKQIKFELKQQKKKQKHKGR